MTEEVKKINKEYKPKFKDLFGKHNNQAEGILKMRDDIEEIEKSVESTTLSVINHFMIQRDEISKKNREDPHQLEKGTPEALYHELSKKVEIE